MTRRQGRWRRRLTVGVGLVGVYLVAAVATMALSDRPFRPLFDGLAPPVPYQWVNPPGENARDNVAPSAAGRESPWPSTAARSSTSPPRTARPSC